MTSTSFNADLSELQFRKYVLPLYIRVQQHRSTSNTEQDIRSSIIPSTMDHIRPFSIEESKQDEFVQSIPKMIQDFLNELPRVETSKLAEDGWCMICHQKYGLENPDADTIEEAEEVVCFPCGHHAGRKCISTWLQTVRQVVTHARCVGRSFFWSYRGRTSYLMKRTGRI